MLYGYVYSKKAAEKVNQYLKDNERTFDEIVASPDCVELIEKAISRVIYGKGGVYARLHNADIIDKVVSDRYTVKETSHENSDGTTESIFVRLSGDGCFADLVSQTYIYAAKYAEKHPDWTGYHCIINGAFAGVYRVIDELRGKATLATDPETGKRYRVGRREQNIADSTFDIVSSYHENEYERAEVLASLVDACETQKQLHLVNMREAGYTFDEIALALDYTDKKAAFRDLEKVRKRYETAAKSKMQILLENGKDE